MAHRQGLVPGQFLPRRIYRLEIELQAVVDLTRSASLPPALAHLDLASDDLTATQAIGEAAQYLGREAILAPSAAGEGNVLAVFIDRLLPGSRVDDVEFEVWTETPGWARHRESRGALRLTYFIPPGIPLRVHWHPICLRRAIEKVRAPVSKPAIPGSSPGCPARTLEAKCGFGGGVDP